MMGRFWSLVDKHGPPWNGTPCWEWTGPKDRGGYGWFQPTAGRSARAHRIAFAAMSGPIPAGLTLDHLCRNRACVNPAHLEPVSGKVNTLRGESAPAQNARKTHCEHGHAFTPENTRHTERQRFCRACDRARWHVRHAAAVLARLRAAGLAR